MCAEEQDGQVCQAREMPNWEVPGPRPRWVGGQRVCSLRSQAAGVYVCMGAAGAAASETACVLLTGCTGSLNPDVPGALTLRLLGPFLTTSTSRVKEGLPMAQSLLAQTIDELPHWWRRHTPPVECFGACRCGLSPSSSSMAPCSLPHAPSLLLGCRCRWRCTAFACGGQEEPSLILPRRGHVRAFRSCRLCCAAR